LKISSLQWKLVYDELHDVISPRLLLINEDSASNSTDSSIIAYDGDFGFQILATILSKKTIDDVDYYFPALNNKQEPKQLPVSMIKHKSIRSKTSGQITYRIPFADDSHSLTFPSSPSAPPSLSSVPIIWNHCDNNSKRNEEGDYLNHYQYGFHFSDPQLKILSCEIKTVDFLKNSSFLPDVREVDIADPTATSIAVGSSQEIKILQIHFKHLSNNSQHHLYLDFESVFRQQVKGESLKPVCGYGDVYKGRQLLYSPQHQLFYVPSLSSLSVPSHVVIKIVALDQQLSSFSSEKQASLTHYSSLRSMFRKRCLNENIINEIEAMMFLQSSRTPSTSSSSSLAVNHSSSDLLSSSSCLSSADNLTTSSSSCDDLTSRISRVSSSASDFSVLPLLPDAAINEATTTTTATTAAVASSSSSSVITTGHDGFIRLLYTAVDDLNVYVVSPCYGGGSVLNYAIKKTRFNRFSELEAKVIFKELLKLMEIIHSYGISHLDVSPENLVFDSTSIPSTLSWLSSVSIECEQGGLREEQEEVIGIPPVVLIDFGQVIGQDYDEKNGRYVKILEGRNSNAGKQVFYCPELLPFEVDFVKETKEHNADGDDEGDEKNGNFIDDDGVTERREPPAASSFPSKMFTASATTGVFQSKPYCPQKVDIWQLGILLFMLLTGYPPYSVPKTSAGQQENKIDKFAHLNEWIKFLHAKTIYQNPVYWRTNEVPRPSSMIPLHRVVSSEAVALLHKLLMINPEERPPVSEILKDPWFSSTNG
jgi:serine/threonine protein kinase